MGGPAVVAVGIAVLLRSATPNGPELVRESMARGEAATDPRRAARFVRAGGAGTRPVGAICLSGPSYRIDPDLDQIVADTIIGAKDICSALNS